MILELLQDSISGLTSQAGFLIGNGLLDLLEQQELDDVQQLEYAQQVKSLSKIIVTNLSDKSRINSHMCQTMNGIGRRSTRGFFLMYTTGFCIYIIGCIQVNQGHTAFWKSECT